MKIWLTSNLKLLFIALGVIILVGCSSDDNPQPVGGNPTGTSGTFSLEAVGESNVSGSVTFTELDDNSVMITLDLQGTANGEMHPAHIHDNTAAEGGPIAISLTEVDGSTGMSETIVTSKDDGSAISYEQLVNYDGYINVHKSSADLATLVVQGDIGQNILTGESKTYELGAVADAEISGSVTFSKRVSGEALATLSLSNTPDGGLHPAHIHANTAAEGGGILFTFNAVDGTSGMSKTNVDALDDGSALTYDGILELDGYVNVHLSADDLATLVGQGDIGQNALTGETKVFDLGSVADPSISGTVTFSKRVNNEALAVIDLEGTPEGGSHPAHIHSNTAAEGGGILITFTSIDGTTGISKTNIASLDDGTTITYSELADIDGYVNVHLSVEDLATLVAQGDIGQNDLTGESKVYDLGFVADPAIRGTLTFNQRVNNEALAIISLVGTPDGGSHPAHIHANTAAESGGILFTFNAIDGTTGISKTNVAAYDDGVAVTFEELIEVDGYVNVHLSVEDLATLVAQGDIGQNALTGESKVYDLGSVADPAISGTLTLSQRVNNEALAVISLDGTPDGGSHPAHIHANTAAESGGILFTFNSIDGTSGISKTNVAAYDDGVAVTYEELLEVDGYVNVHLSVDDLATLVAQGDIGQNELTGMSTVYALLEKDVTGVTGTTTFYERVNGETLVIMTLAGISFDGDHPAHIHAGSVAEAPGAIVTTLASVDATGSSKTNVTMQDDGTAVSYSEMVEIDGYINVHLSASDLATLVAQGNVGVNG